MPVLNMGSCVSFVGLIHSVDLRCHLSVAVEDLTIGLSPLTATPTTQGGTSPSKRKFTAYMPGNVPQAPSTSTLPAEPAAIIDSLPESQTSVPAEEGRHTHVQSPSMFV